MPESASSVVTRANLVERRKASRGLVLPNPASFRVGQLPTITANPPIVTLGAPRVLPTTGYVTHVMTDAIFRYFGGAVALAGLTSPNNGFYSGSYITTATGPYSVDFMYDGDIFEMYMKGNGGEYQLWVDGQWATAAPVEPVTSDGNRYYIKFDFGSRAVRHIRFDFQNNWFFGGIARKPDSTLWTAHLDLGPRFIVIGDSFTEGTGTDPILGYARIMGYMLGCPDTWASGVGGTGYLNPSTGGKVKLGTRIAADVVARSPGIVLVAMGLNDSSYNPGSGIVTASQIATEAVLDWQAIKAGSSKPTLIVIGPWIGSSNQQVLRDENDALKAAAPGAGVDLYIDNYSGNINNAWLFGTGKVGGTNGTGNADYYRGTDGIHPSPAGHVYYGYRAASDIAAWVTAGAPSGAVVTNGLVVAP
jgi:lysophospholipase L1-like esterase